MKSALNNGKYLIMSIVSESEDITVYIARDHAKQQFVVNEIKSISLINEWLPKINGLSEEGRICCFTESSNLYIVTRYYDGDNPEYVFSGGNTELSMKLEMIKAFTFSLISYSEFPDFILKSLLLPENVCIYRNELHSNCMISTDEKKTPMQLFYDLISGYFTIDDVKKLSYISIVIEKLKNDVYSDFMQLYLDMDQLTGKLQQNSAISKLKSFYQRSKGYITPAISAAVIVLAIIVIYNMFIKVSKASTGQTHNPIDHIGTVVLEENTSQQTTEAE